MKLEFAVNRSFVALSHKTGLTFSELEKSLFESLAIEPEDTESEDLSHFPAEEIWVAAGRLGVLNSDITPLRIIEL